MKRGAIIAFAATAIIGAASAAYAASATIVGSPHDLSAVADGGSKTTQVCVFCHTPHNAAQNVPLWNRSNPAGAGFKLYTSSATLQMKSSVLTGFSSDSISLFCMGCHDGGALAGSRIHNEPAASGAANNGLIPDSRYASAAFDSDGAAGANLPTNNANFGTNLTSSHPVNFPYNEGLDTAFNAKSGTKVGTNIPLFYASVGGGGAKVLAVECSSCHAVHGANGPGGNMMPKFIRSTMKGSALCVACHKK